MNAAVGVALSVVHAGGTGTIDQVQGRWPTRAHCAPGQPSRSTMRAGAAALLVAVRAVVSMGDFSYSLYTEIPLILPKLPSHSTQSAGGSVLPS